MTTTTTTTSRFVWFDYATSDPARARAFYAPVAGWDKAMHGAYEMWKAPHAAVGGIVAGSPAHWLGYVAVANADASVARAQTLGAAVETPVADIPEVGRFAILREPQGARFAIFQPAPGGDAPDPSKPGAIGWGELNTTDSVAAMRFYGELFGWTNAGELEVGGAAGTYRLYADAPGHAIGGMSNAAVAMNAPAHWLFYINVPELDVALAQVRAHGGTIMWGPMPTPGGSVIAGGADAQGALFGLAAPAA